MQIKNVLTALNEIIDSSACIWDNVGLLVGNENNEIKNCMLSLDFTKDVLNEAIEKDVQLVINHHPIIFDALKQITSESYAYKAIQNNISVFCAHTNLDATVGGINDQLVKMLGFECIKNIIIDDLPLCKLCKTNKEMTSQELALYVKDKLNLNVVSYTKGQPINTVAVLGGGGNAGVELILDCADALITGEVKHENSVLLYNNDITLVQAGHFYTESVILEPLCKRLQEKIPNIKFFVAESNKGISEFI